jgi:hypothetical protein
MLTVLVNGSCKRNSTENQNNPALELYCKYADSTNLTVAYLSDFKIHGSKINTVMIQAEDENAWEWLLDEFTVPKQILMGITGNIVPDPSYSVEVGMKWDTPLVIGDDIFTKEHLSDEEIAVFAQAIVNEFSSTLNSFLESDNEVHNASIIINDDFDLMNGISFGMDFKDTTAVKRILQTVADQLNNNGLSYNDTVLNTNSRFGQIDQPSSIMPDAKQYAEDGYIAAVDHINNTLWVFFYDDKEECINILKHIRKDIMVFQKNSVINQSVQ